MPQDEPRNADDRAQEGQGPALPHGVQQLADYAAHDLAELAVITATAPAFLRPHLLHIGTTMQRLALYLEAVLDEGHDCRRRVVARARQYEAELAPREGAADDAEHARQVWATITEFFVDLAQRRSGPADARERNVGFKRNGDGDHYAGG